MANKTSKKPEKNQQDIERDILLTEEEYAKKVRQKNKEAMNRVLRVVGLFASFILIYAGLFDPLFEMSFFGWMFDKESYNFIWEAMVHGDSPIYDDPMQFGLWLPKIGITIIIILAVIGTVYLLAYNIIDIVALIRNFLKGTQDITKDLTVTVKDTANDDKDLSNLRKKLTKKPEDDLFKEPDKKEKKAKEPRKPFFKKKEKQPVETLVGGYTDEQLDRLLSGEDITEGVNENLPPLEDDTTNEKELF